MMKKRRIFGTDGIRGRANLEPMSSETALKLGRACAHVFRRDKRRHRILIGKDTRLSGYMLESAITAGICSMGVDVILVGPLPTPGIAFMTRSLRADAGVVISASHNSFEDNGIKFFFRDGFKLPDQTEEEIENLVFTGGIDHIRPTARAIGKAYRVDDAVGRYVEFVKNTFPREQTLEGMKIVVDCANGASYKTAPLVLRELGAEVVSLNVAPDGRNINRRCGSVHPEGMCKAVLRHRADIGMSLDGDADRVLLADEEGTLVDGDHILAICALDAAAGGRLAGNGVVGTVMSNYGLEVVLQKAGIRLVRADVGDRYVVEEMVRAGYRLGGEQSGHILFLDHQTTGDGIVSSLQVLAVMKRTGRKLSRLASSLKPYPQVLLNVPVGRKVPFEEVPELGEAVSRAERKLRGRGRVLVRYSGTEAKIRVMVEGKSRREIDKVAATVAAVASAALAATEGVKQ